jgi:plasmid replication initiation protein
MAQISTRKQEQTPTVKDVAKISNALIESFVRQNNLVALKTLFYIARADVKVPNAELTTFEIDTTSLCNYCHIDKKTLQRNIKQMTETSISIVDDKSESYITVIPKAKFITGTNKVEIKMFKEVLELIWQVEKRFTVIDVKALMSLDSKHSVRMIQLLEMIQGFDNAKRKHYTLAELNLMFGTEYKTFTDFERKILIPVKEELDVNSKLSFIYTVVFKVNPKGKGRPIADHVIIDLVQNTPQGKLF